MLRGGEQLHRADDVLVLHGRAAPVLRVGGTDQGQVHHGINVKVGEEATDRTRIRPDPLDPVEQVGELATRLRWVDSDDPPDPRVGGEPRGDVGTEVATDAGHDDNPRGTGGATGGHAAHRPRQARSSRNIRGLIT